MDSRDARLEGLLFGLFGDNVDLARVRGEVVRLMAEARAAWPSLPLDEDAFVPHLARHAQSVEALGRVRGADLFLAFACASGDSAAIAAFERAHATDLRAVYAQVRGVKVPFEELVQVLRGKLFAGPAP